MENMGGDLRVKWVANKSLKLAETTEIVVSPQLSNLLEAGSRSSLLVSFRHKSRLRPRDVCLVCSSV